MLLSQIARAVGIRDACQRGDLARLKQIQPAAFDRPLDILRASEVRARAAHQVCDGPDLIVSEDGPAGIHLGDLDHANALRPWGGSVRESLMGNLSVQDPPPAVDAVRVGVLPSRDEESA